jgi:hypothetical protein
LIIESSIPRDLRPWLNYAAALRLIPAHAVPYFLVRRHIVYRPSASSGRSLTFGEAG